MRPEDNEEFEGQAESPTENSENESESIEGIIGEALSSSTEYYVSTVDYSTYFKNLQTCNILILSCLVAVGCIVAWVGAKRE